MPTTFQAQHFLLGNDKTDSLLCKCKISVEQQNISQLKSLLAISEYSYTLRMIDEMSEWRTEPFGNKFLQLFKYFSSEQ